MAKINYAQAFEDAELTLMDFVRGRGRQPITPGMFSAISYAVYECADRDQAIAANGSEVASGELDPAAVVFTPATTDGGTWTKDATGYNFRYDSPAEDRPTGATWHRYQFKFTPETGSPFFVVWIVETLPIAGS